MMAHELALTANGEHAMAYIGNEPWHGLGQRLEEGASIETWAQASGMDMPLMTAPARCETNSGAHITLPDKKIIYRADTDEALSCVGVKYKIVQPIEVLDFFKRYVGSNAKLETAGLLFGGRTYWAMARLDGELNVGGDITRPYLLLNSSCDGSSATTARLTSVRVVCNNTLSMASKERPDVVIRHNQAFCGETLGAKMEEHYASLKAYGTTLKMLSKVKVDAAKAHLFVTTLLDGVKAATAKVKPTRGSARILELFAGEGIGAKEEPAKGTAYGLLNAVTEYYDHEYGRTQEGRLNDAWFGFTSGVKKKFAADLALAIAA
jgi:phage/plasmid-like protein (TIGR03299 family)